MNHQVQIDMGVRKDGGKDAGRAAQTEEGKKLLAASFMKKSFKVSFDSMFLDMLLPVSEQKVVERPVRVEQMKQAERPAEPVRDARPPDRPEQQRPAPDGASDPKTEAKQELHNEKNSGEAEKPKAEDSREVQKSEGSKEGKEASKAAESEKDKRTEKSDEKQENTLAQLKVVKYELTAKFEKALSAEDRAILKRQIEELLDEEGLGIDEFLTRAMDLIRDLAAKIGDGGIQIRQSVSIEKIMIEATDLTGLDEVKDLLSSDDKKRYMKRLLFHIKDALEASFKKGPEMENVPPPKDGVEQKADGALMKLLRKMDARNEKSGIDVQAKNALEQKPAENAAELLRRLSVDADRDTSKAVRTASESVRDKSEVVKGPENAPRKSMEPLVEQVAAELFKGRGRARGEGKAGGTGEAAVKAAALSPKLGGGESFGQNSWQSGYNQNSSTKGLELLQSAAKAQRTFRSAQNSVLEQIVQNAKIVIKGEKGEATIKLHPEFLGKVELKLVVDNGKATVRMTAENAMVRNIISENIQDLRRNLTELGLDVENVVVTTTGEFADGEAETGNGEEREGARFGTGEPGWEDEGSDEEAFKVEEIDGSTVRYVA